MTSALIATLRRWLPREGRILLVLLTVVLGAWFFLFLSAQAVSGRARIFDERILLAFRSADDASVPIGPQWLRHAALEITSLGSGIVLLVVIAVVAGYLALLRRHGLVAAVLTATFGGMILSSAMKGLFGRVRPSVVPHLADVSSPSFPSGHSMLSAVVYMTLGALLARTTTDWRLRTYFLGVATRLTFSIGMTRLYLGVHYPTDVLAGWTAGLLWALLCDLVARRLQRRGAVAEPEVPASRPSSSNAA